MARHTRRTNVLRSWKRSPIAKRGNIVALSAELHYVRVYTSQGDALVLSNLGEAVQSFAPGAGLQIHRSHWVAVQEVRAVQGSKRALRLKMSNDLDLPVSRSRADDVIKRFGPPVG